MNNVQVLQLIFKKVNKVNYEANEATKKIARPMRRTIRLVRPVVRHQKVQQIGYLAFESREADHQDNNDYNQANEAINKAYLSSEADHEAGAVITLQGGGEGSNYKLKNERITQKVQMKCKVLFHIDFAICQITFFPDKI